MRNKILAINQCMKYIFFLQACTLFLFFGDPVSRRGFDD